MNHLSNAFSLLAPEVPDDEIQITTAAANNGENAKGKGKNKKRSDRSGDIILSKDENDSQPNLKVVSGEYKLPLVWIDLEMTGS